MDHKEAKYRMKWLVRILLAQGWTIKKIEFMVTDASEEVLQESQN